MSRLSGHDDSVHREDDGAVRFDDLADKFKAKFDGTSQWSIAVWITFLAKGGGPKKKFSYCLNPNSSKHFLYFRAIQGNSEGTLVDLPLQDTVLLPDDFAEYINHIGNAHDMHSIIQSGLTPGEKSLKMDRPSVFFTAVNPVYAHQDLEEVQYYPDKPRIMVYKNTWRVHLKTVFWCNLKLAQRKGLQFCQTRSHAIALFNTLPAICVEKSGIPEDWRGFILQSTSIPKVTARCPHAKICNMDVKIFLIPKQDHQSERCAKYEETRRSLLEDTRRKHNEVSTGTPVAVTLITEIQVYLTQPSRKKTLIARKPSKD